MIRDMSRIFVIMGKSASGKDSLYQMIVDKHPELRKVVTYTTRPIRAGERYGREYFFVSEEEMRDLDGQDKIIECRRYDTIHGEWYYFTVNDGQIDLNGGDDYILITTLEGYNKLARAFGRENVVPLYIEVDDLTRLERAIEREKKQTNPCVSEICRRFLADAEDFSEENLREAGVKGSVVNNDFDEAYAEIEKIIAN